MDWPSSLKPPPTTSSATASLSSHDWEKLLDDFSSPRRHRWLHLPSLDLVVSFLPHRDLPSHLRPLLLSFIDNHLFPPSLQHLSLLLNSLLSFPSDHPLHNHLLTVTSAFVTTLFTPMSASSEVNNSIRLSALPGVSFGWSLPIGKLVWLSTGAGSEGGCRSLFFRFPNLLPLPLVRMSMAVFGLTKAMKPNMTKEDLAHVGLVMRSPWCIEYLCRSRKLRALGVALLLLEQEVEGYGGWREGEGGCYEPQPRLLSFHHPSTRTRSATP